MKKSRAEKALPKNSPTKRVGSGRLVRRLVIDWRAIAKETGCTRGTLAHSPVFGWGVRGNGPADFCAITPPTIAEGEELRIEEGMWAVYSPNK